MRVVDLLLGRPLASDEARAECVGPAVGIPIFGLDALSSAAYGPEAALTLLIPLGAIHRLAPRELDQASITGLRKGCQYGLTWDMVDWNSRELHIPRTKNEEPLHVPLKDAAISALKIVFKSGDGKGRVFTSAKTGEPLENGRHWFDDVVVQAKLKNFHWHDLRHTFASRLRMKGAPLEDIADLLGHKSLTMTRRYAHLGPNNLHAVVSLLGASDPTSDTGQTDQTATTSQVAVQ